MRPLGGLGSFLSAALRSSLREAACRLDVVRRRAQLQGPQLGRLKGSGVETRRNAETTAEAAALPCPGQRRHGRARAPKCRAGPRAQGAFLSSLFCAFQALARGAACGGGEANAGHAGADAGAVSVALKSESRPFSAFPFLCRQVEQQLQDSPPHCITPRSPSQLTKPSQSHVLRQETLAQLEELRKAYNLLQDQAAPRFFAFVCFTQARKHVAFIHLLTEVASPSAVLALVVSSPSRYSIFPFLPLSLKLSLSLSFSFSSGSGSGRGVHRTGGC